MNLCAHITRSRTSPNSWREKKTGPDPHEKTSAMSRTFFERYEPQVLLNFVRRQLWRRVVRLSLRGLGLLLRWQGLTLRLPELYSTRAARAGRSAATAARRAKGGRKLDAQAPAGDGKLVSDATQRGLVVTDRNLVFCRAAGFDATRVMRCCYRGLGRLSFHGVTRRALLSNHVRSANSSSHISRVHAQHPNQKSMIGWLR